jgi:NTP pyrophosphatase (non-canonical NTP hydrolase)
VSENASMTLADYQRLAMRTAADSPIECAAMGLCGEAGEFADLLKKHLYHGHPLDHDRATKELGDVLWYVALACERLGVSLEAVAGANIEKLLKRYPDGFSSEASLRRVDAEVRP